MITKPCCFGPGLVVGPSTRVNPSFWKSHATTTRTVGPPSVTGRSAVRFTPPECTTVAQRANRASQGVLRMIRHEYQTKHLITTLTSMMPKDNVTSLSNNLNGGYCADNVRQCLLVLFLQSWADIVALRRFEKVH